MQYEPEIGQMCFGQPWKKFQASNLMIAALRSIERRLEIVQLNRSQEYEYNSPFGNTGERFENDVFVAYAYSWDDSKEQPYNFKWNDIEVSWYKYLGRGTSVNREVSSEEIAKMLDECLVSLDKFDEETWERFKNENP